MALDKVEVAVLGDVVEGLPGFSQGAVDVDRDNLHKLFVDPSPPLDLLLLLLLTGGTGLFKSTQVKEIHKSKPLDELWILEKFEEGWPIIEKLAGSSSSAAWMEVLAIAGPCKLLLNSKDAKRDGHYRPCRSSREPSDWRCWRVRSWKVL